MRNFKVLLLLLLLLLLSSNIYANTLVNCNTELVSGSVFYRGVEDGFGYSGYNIGFPISHELVECVPVNSSEDKPMGDYIYYVKPKLVSRATSFTKAVQLDILVAPPNPPKNIQVGVR